VNPPVSVFVVGRRLPADARTDREAEHRALAEAARRLTMGSDEVRYLWSYALRERCLEVFEASDGDLVRRAHEIAQVRFEWIDEGLASEHPGQATR
jgi:hypothetical protein